MCFFLVVTQCLLVMMDVSHRRGSVGPVVWVNQPGVRVEKQNDNSESVVKWKLNKTGENTKNFENAIA
ncbi:hypothetical protein VTH06DRAFT_7837 [Thermothelomyces fergusii]